MESSTNEHKMLKFMKILVPVVGIGLVLTAVVLALSIVTLVKVNKGFDDIQSDNIEATNPTNPTTGPTTAATIADTTTTITTSTTTATTTTTTSQPLPNSILASAIRIEDVMHLLDDLQTIATHADGNRAIHTRG
ncbi:unnamed protein product, partial [Adineta steineri]